MGAILAIFSIYYFVTAIYTEVVNQADWNFYSVYTLILLFAVVILAIAGMMGNKNSRIKIDAKAVWKPHIFIVPVLVIMWFFVRYDVFVQGLIWFDEATQFIPYWSLEQSVDCVKYAAMQQQMPLDYYTSYAFLKIFGVNTEALFFHARMYGLLSCLVLYVVFHQLRFHWFLILLGFCLFLSQSTILRYSGEARPISLTVFWGLVNLYYFFHFIKSEKSNFLTGLLPSSLLLLLSTGLQPVIQIFILSFALKIQNTNKQKNISFELNFLISMLLVLPLMWNIYQNTAGVVPNFKSQDLYSSILDLFKNISAEQFKIFFSEINQGLIYLLLSSVALCSIIEIKKRNLKRPLAFWSYFLIFPAFFVWIWSVMDWYLSPHYYVLWVVTLVVVSLDIINNAQLPNISRNYFKAIFLGAAVLLSASFVKSEAEKFSHYKHMPDLRKLHSHERSGINTVYLSMPLQHPDDNGFYLDYVGIFYETNDRHFLSNKYESIFQNKLKKIRPDLESFFNKDQNKWAFNNIDIVMLLYCGAHIENPYCNSDFSRFILSGLKPEVITLNSFYKALIFRDQMDLGSSLSQTYEHIEEVMKQSPWLIKYYQLKMKHHINLSEYELAEKYVEFLIDTIDSHTFVDRLDVNNIYQEAKKNQSYLNLKLNR